MKYIKKGSEPNSLTKYRKQKDAYFDGYTDKDDLRKSLLTEQKYICCYCMQRISKEDKFGRKQMRIEHWNSQSEYPTLQLVYSNLLGACTGNEGKPEHLQHCDVHRKNTPLKINPTSMSCESLIKFRADGEIYSADCEINKDLDTTLNLNTQTLKYNRALTLEWYTKKLSDSKKGIWSKDILQKEIDKWENTTLVEYEPYCQIVISYLKKKLNKY
jgi:uncharacterized protein (TIGR02646 family)